LRFLVLLMGLLAAISPIRAEELERTLIPIATTAITVPGAHGAQWETAFVAYNSGDEDLFIRYLDAACLHISPCPEGLAIEPNRVTREFRWARGPDAGTTYPPGVLIYLPPEAAGNLHFHLRIRDVSRAAESAGTEIPVVREPDFRSGPIHLLDVPADPFFRAHLRLYGPDGVGGSFLVGFFDQETNMLLAQETISLQAHVSGFSHFFPDYAEIAGIQERHPMLLGSELVRVAIEPLTPGLRFWAFISITNNETQHVTLVTPQ
jgi:hypothetical protein